MRAFALLHQLYIGIQITGGLRGSIPHILNAILNVGVSVDVVMRQRHSSIETLASPCLLALWSSTD